MMYGFLLSWGNGEIGKYPPLMMSVMRVDVVLGSNPN